MATDNRKVQLGITVNDETQEGLDSAKNRIRDTARVFKDEGAKAAKGVNDIGDASEGAAKKVDASTKSLIAQIQRVTAEAQAGAKGTEQYFRAIAQQRGLDQSALEPYLQGLTKARAAQDAAARSMDNLGMTAKQTTAALRQVPAQFTDIIVSLQGGQAPLTVLLQQGGQLRDVFGGVGAAAQALGGYIATLITPVNTLIAAVAGLAIAYEAGRSESEKLAQSIITTGNAAGTTVGQLNQAAAAIDLVVGTQGKAAEALGEFVKAGVQGKTALQEFATAAIRFERVTGQAVSDTAKQFADLGRDPLQATLKLNDGMNFLTQSTYEQIKALTEQGRSVEAARVAQEAFANALNERATQMEGNLGLIERGWKSITGAVKEAWDALKGIGREVGAEGQLTAVNQSIATLERTIQERSKAGFNTQLLDAELAKLKERQGILSSDVRLLRQAADLQRENAEAVKARAEFDKQGQKFLSDQVKMEREIAAVQELARRGKVSELELERRIADIRKSYEKKPSSGMSAEEKELKARADLLAKLSGVNADYVEQLGRIQKMREQGVISEQQSIDLLNELIEKQPMAAKLIKEQADAEKERQKVLEQLAKEQEKQLDAALNAADATNQQAIAQEQANAVFGQGKSALAELTLAELEQQRAALEMTDNVIPGYIQALEARISAQKRLVTALKEGEAKDAAADAAKKAQSEWQKAAEKIQDSLTDALMRGFESGKDFARVLRDTVVNMFQTMVLRPVIQAVVNPVAGAITGALGVGSSGVGGGAGGLLSTASSLNSLYSAATGGLVTGLASSISSLGSLFGSTAVSSFASGMASVAPGFMGPSLAGAGGAAGAGASFGAFLSNPWTIGIGALALGWDSLFGRKLKDQGIQGTFGGDGFSGNSFQFYKGGWFRSDKTTTGALDPALDRALDQQFMALKATALGLGDVLGVTGDALDGFSQSIKISFNGLNEQQIQEKLNEQFGKIGDNLAQEILRSAAMVEIGPEFIRPFAEQIEEELADRSIISFIRRLGGEYDTRSAEQRAADEYIKQFAREGETASQTLTRLAGSLQAVNGVFEKLNITLFDTSLAGADMASELLDMFGGGGAFRQLAQSFYQNFYTEAERQAALFDDVVASLYDMSSRGLFATAQEEWAALTDEQGNVRQEFRALIESLDLTTESGRQAYVELMRLSPAFAEVATNLENTQGAVESLSETLRSLQQEQQSLQRELLALQGGDLRAFDTAGFTEAELAAYDFNEALRQQIATLRQAAAAADEAARAEADRIRAVASEAAALQRQILELNGDTAAIAAADRAAIAPENLGLYDEVIRLREAASRAAAAARASEEARAAADRARQERERAAEQAAAERQRRLEQIANERAGLETRLLQLQGNTLELRRRERAELDASNRALYDRVVALEDQQRIQQERAGLERELLQLQGNTVALRELERNELDASNRALFDQVEALRKANAVQSERDGLQRQLLEVLGDQAALRELERNSLDESNRALYDQIQALRAAKEAWSGVTDTLANEVRRIRGLIAGESTATLAQAQTQFAIATAAARAGDVAAARSLPELSQTVLRLSEANAASLYDLQRIRASIAASLENTAGAIAPYSITPIQTTTDGEISVSSVQMPTSNASSETTALIAEVRALREENRAQALSLVNLQTRLARVVERWDVDGIPEERATA